MTNAWRWLRSLFLRRRAPAQTPVPPRDGPDLLLGSAVLQLLVERRRWVRRRLETVELVDAHTQERRVSISFDLPLATPGAAEAATVVPLAVLRKESVTVEIRTATGAPVPALSPAESEFVAWSVLAAAARIAAPGATDILDRSLLRALRRIVTSSPANARAALDDLLGGTDPLRAALGRSEIFRTVARALADGFLLLTRAPDQPPGRKLLQMKYRDAVEPARGSPRRRRGWSPATFVVAVPGASEARSYRFEMTAPPDVDLVAASAAESAQDAVRPDTGSDGRSVVRIDLEAGSDEPPTDVWVSVGPKRKGVLRRSLASTGTHVLLLAGGLWRLAKGLEPPDLSIAALGLAGVTSLLVSVEPHDSLAGRLVAGPRRCAALSGLLSLAAAAGIVFAAPDPPARRLWEALALAAFVSFAAVAVAYARARPRRARRAGGRASFIAPSAEVDVPEVALTRVWSERISGPVA